MQTLRKWAELHERSHDRKAERILLKRWKVESQKEGGKADDWRKTLTNTFAQK